MFAFLDGLARDLRFGLRNFMNNPGFTIMAAGSLALGIGATSAMFSVIYAVLIDPFPYKDVTGATDRLAILAAGPPALLAGAIRAQVYSIDKDQPVTDVKAIETMLDEWVYSAPRFNLLLFSIFAALGLILALFGIYGVVSSSIAHRRREIGIRMALGATIPQVIRMILASGMKLVGAGVLLGVIASLLSAQVLARQIWKLSTFDPFSFIAVSALVILTGLLACFWPARAAARIDPIAALRQE